ncbi:hypothetical protein M758_7G115400 [Ceratodon purpureus]|nr:hypothetical protein M758_7G115400 [Ceratodon purpureus]
MGCKVSKSGPEPCASKILGCNKLARSYSSPIQLADVQNSLQNPKCESFHLVSLTSSTYGSLSTPPLKEEQGRAANDNLEHGSFERIKNDRNIHAVTVPYSWSHEADPGMIAPSQSAKIEGANPRNAADYKEEQTVNMWELMESLEDKKAALQMLRGLMDKSRDGKSSPRMSTTIHTVEELDSVLDVRRSFPTNHRIQRRFSMEPVMPVRDSHKFESDSKKMRETPFSMQLNHLSLTMQKNQEAKEFDSVRKKDFCWSQELNSTERSDLSHRQDLDSIRRSNLTRSQEFDTLRRSILSRDQGVNFTRRNNLSQSQEFVRPPLAKPKEAVAPRQSLSGVPTAACISDYERKVVTSQPDPVLRSPMLIGLSGHERLRVRPGQQSPMSSLASPKLSGSQQTTFSLDEAPVLDSYITVNRRRSASEAVTPATSRRSAEVSSLRDRNSKDTSVHVAMQPPMSKYLNVSRPIDDTQGVNIKTNYNVSKIPPHGFVAASNDKTNVIVPQESTQDVANLSTVKQSGRNSATSKESTFSKSSSSTAWSSSASKESTSSTTSSSTATSSAHEKSRSQGGRESEMGDSISSGYEVVPNTELLDQKVRRPSGSFPTKQPSQSATGLLSDTNCGQNTVWSADLDRPNSLPLDPELLASFEEALELFCADDWCTVRLGESEPPATSGSNSELDRPSWQRETKNPRSNLAGESKLNRCEILEDHVEKFVSQPGVIKKAASSKIVPLEIGEQRRNSDPLENFEKKCPPGGEERCVLYTTSLRGIRKTFDDCSQTRAILQSSNVQIDERDIAMHAEFRQEMISLAGKSASVPRLFIKGRHIGGGEEVSQLHEKGILSKLLQGLPRQVSQTVCDG